VYCFIALYIYTRHFLTEGIYLFAGQKDKCREKVWKKVWSLRRGKEPFEKVFSPPQALRLIKQTGVFYE